MPDLADIVKIAVVSTLTEKGAKARSGKFEFETSIPPAFGGVGGIELPTPPQLILVALANCFAEVFKYLAEQKGLSFEDLKVRSTAELDLDAVKTGNGYAGLRNIKIEVSVKGLSEEEAKALVEEVEMRCPMCPTLTNENFIEIKLKTS